jgi:hypothetical protein
MQDKPWEAEPNHLLFDSHGYVCEIRRHPNFGTLNGYVYIPLEHPVAQAKIPEDVLNVHGGITYWDERNGSFVVGFDCAHAGDVLPYRIDPTLDYADDTYKDIAFVTNELENLAQQLKEKEDAN